MINKETDEKNAEDNKETFRETTQNDMSELSHLKKESTKTNEKKKKNH